MSAPMTSTRSRFENALFVFRATVSLILLTVTALVMLLVAIATFAQARRLYSEWIATPMGRVLLKIWGIRLVVHQSEPFPRGQTVYISNHTSTIDLFALIALGLPRTRFFLSGYLRKVLPLGLIGYLIGIFWTVPQTFPAERMRIFQRAERSLRRTGDSVYLSPEGGRVTSGGIGPFNKGAFHLATALRAPIVPLLIAIPPEIDPGRGLHARSGVVHVFVKAPFDTTDWKLEDLVANKERLRDLFVAWNQEHRR
jgi:1-acyl-sn-glycerol-3-phosphate acyltransferase